MNHRRHRDHWDVEDFGFPKLPKSFILGAFITAILNAVFWIGVAVAVIVIVKALWV